MGDRSLSQGGRSKDTRPLYGGRFLDVHGDIHKKSDCLAHSRKGMCKWMSKIQSQDAVQDRRQKTGAMASDEAKAATALTAAVRGAAARKAGPPPPSTGFDLIRQKSKGRIGAEVSEDAKKASVVWGESVKTGENREGGLSAAVVLPSTQPPRKLVRQVTPHPKKQ